MPKNEEDKKYKILFLCGSNSCRSQMAEGFVNNLWNNKFEAYSAGATTTDVNPNAIKVMKEVNIDISNQKSKLVTVFNGQTFDYVITLCKGDLGGVCPLFIGNAKNTIDWRVPDPAKATGSEDEILNVFRKVRDRIKNAIEELIKNL
ncbi:MAG: arsenate reductase ArsC [Candidatus Helarchaeota archaeon]